jgi:predicted permease
VRILKHELKLAANSLLKIPGFSITVITTLAITLGALICIFNLNHLLLVKSLPYPDANKLMVLEQSYLEDGKTYSGAQSAPGMIVWYKQQQEFSELALLRDVKGQISDHPEQPSVLASYVTSEYFSLLQPEMHLGRGISDNEGFGEHQPVALLSYDTWKNYYQSQPDIVNQKLMLGDVSYKIIGVTAKTFHAPANRNNEAIQLWLPWDFQGLDPADWGIQTRALTGMGKLKDGITNVQAITSLSRQINEEYITSDEARPGDTVGAVLTPLKQKIIGDSKNIALLLLAGVVGLLLIAITNVTNLFLSRAAEKQRVMAIQAALGAKPSHLFYSMFAESLLLCVAAGLLGLLVAGWGFVLLQELAAKQLPRITELGLDNITLAFTLLIVLTLAAIFAKLSSRVVNYAKLQSQLASSGKGSGLQVSSRTRHILIIMQVTLASLLLVGASVIIQEALKTVFQPLGYNEKNISYMRFEASKDYNSSAQINLLTNEVKTKILQLPQVEDVARTIAPTIFQGAFSIQLKSAQQKRLGSFATSLVDRNYFDVIELPIVTGRTFTEETSSEDDINEIILSESLARHLVPNGDAIGKSFSVGGGDKLYKTVGIVKDYYSPTNKDQTDFYRYYLSYSPFRELGLEIRLKQNGILDKQTIRTLLENINPKLRLRTLVSHAQMHDALIYRHKLAAGLTITLSALALLLAAAGIYGVLTYSIQMRRYELGIHLALGAKTHRILNMVLKESLKPVLQGLAGSLVLVGLLFLLARQQLSSMIQLDLVTMVCAMFVLLLVSYLACYLPARKVIMEDPVKALRNE